MLALDGVSHAYGGNAALREVTLNIGEGELVALTGANGSGKSTLLKIAARVIEPREGDVSFEGRRLPEWPSKEYARLVGYLPQDPDPAFPMRALDVVVSGRAPYLRRFAWESSSDWDAARHALDLCDAAHLADRWLDEMSGGERKRVHLARVLAASPRLILLDEPLAALDLAHVQQVSLLLRGIVERTGCTVVFAAHDLNWAAAHSDRMLVMREGALALDSTPDGVMRADVLRALFGFDARTISSGDRTWIVPR